MKTLVLLSGGMDSVTALHWSAREYEVVGTVSFDYGSKHNAKEIPMAAWHAAQLRVKHETIALDFVNRLFASDLLQSGGEIPEGHYAAENMKKTVVPFRNGIMLSVAFLGRGRGGSYRRSGGGGGDVLMGMILGSMMNRGGRGPWIRGGGGFGGYDSGDSFGGFGGGDSGGGGASSDW